ncbi:MAG: hypothetical protein AMXMBFR61_25500 [Fimbriimonadales bacterium]
MSKTTLGVIVGNRGFFPDHLCKSGRERILALLEQMGFGTVVLPESVGKFGSVETYVEAKACAELFRKHANEIDGILVTLPNFGDERAVADTIRLAGLNVPVLVHAFADKPAKMSLADRADSFCGKMSVCNNLRQYGIPFSLTALHTVDPEDASFREDLQRFGATCRVVRGLRNLRVGCIGARPAAFNTVRYSEKLLERSGITVETLDLSEVIGRANRLGSDDPKVENKLEEIRAYTQAEGIPAESLDRMARLGVVVDAWMQDRELAATAFQCWTSIEEFYGIVPCTLMSMMSDRLMPSACETDIAGLLGMHILQLASGKPSALLDWNNNYGEDPDKCVVFHCSNLPKSVLREQRMSLQDIIAASVGRENAYGTIVGRMQPGPFSFLRISTDDLAGEIVGYVGEGRVTDDPLDTFGGYGVVEVPNLQLLLHYICANGFEHHVAANLSEVAAPVYDALTTYLEWDIHWHA